jgi:hypothetical protein
MRRDAWAVPAQRIAAQLHLHAEKANDCCQWLDSVGAGARFRDLKAVLCANGVPHAEALEIRRVQQAHEVVERHVIELVEPFAPRKDHGIVWVCALPHAAAE